MGGAVASRVAFAYSAGEILERVLRMPCFRFVVVVFMGAAVSVAGVYQFCGLHVVSSSGWVFPWFAGSVLGVPACFCKFADFLACLIACLLYLFLVVCVLLASSASLLALCLFPVLLGSCPFVCMLVSCLVCVLLARLLEYFLCSLVRSLVCLFVCLLVCLFPFSRHVI